MGMRDLLKYWEFFSLSYWGLFYVLALSGIVVFVGCSVNTAWRVAPFQDSHVFIETGGKEYGY